jgi:hypothetical protein
MIEHTHHESRGTTCVVQARHQTASLTSWGPFGQACKVRLCTLIRETSPYHYPLHSASVIRHHGVQLTFSFLVCHHYLYVHLLNTPCFSSPAYNYTLALTPTSSNSSTASYTASSSSTASTHLSPPSFSRRHRSRSRSKSPRGYQVTLDLGMLDTGSGEGDEERPGSSGGQSIRETLDKMAGFRRALRYV